MIIDEFVDDVLRQTYPDAHSVVAGPSTRNERSIAAFERAGFRRLREQPIPGEEDHELLMIRDLAPA